MVSSQRKTTEDSMSKALAQTDLRRWHLELSPGGLPNWIYDCAPETKRKQSFQTKYWLSLLSDSDAAALPGPQGNPAQAARNGFEFLKKLQSPDGHWSCSTAGSFIGSAGLAFSCYVTKTPLPEEVKIELVRYFANQQRRGPSLCDQGWGFNVADKSTVFGTALNYVACRLLGVDSDAPMLVRARCTLHALGGAKFIPTWGKVWLSILNLYDWEGTNPMPPEMWLLPNFLPFHPSRWWVNTRAVYNPMSYLSGKRFQTELDTLLKSLREELYTQPYDSIHWPSCRNLIAKEEVYVPHHPVAKYSFWMLGYWEKICPKKLRGIGVEYAYQLCRMEDENTGFVHSSCVQKALNMIVCWEKEGSESQNFKKNQASIREHLWMSREGMYVMPTEGSQLWDVAFITQALIESGLAETGDKENQQVIVKALEWLDKSQILENPKYYLNTHRHPPKGSWAFGVKKQACGVSDCTAEALKSILHLQQGFSYAPKPVAKERFYLAVDAVLSFQTADGGFTAFEPIRGPKWLEFLNCSDLFAGAMVERSFTECTTSCITALTLFEKFYPEYRSEEINQTIQSAIEFVQRSQNSDGSWFGTWGICYIYGTMFGLEGLSVNNETYANSRRVRRACKFLLDRQRDDGGWGEARESIFLKTYIENPSTQVVQTAWAILALLTAQYPHPGPIKKACKLIMDRQKPSGEWEIEVFAGCSNETILMIYALHSFIWPIWALGKAHKRFGQALMDN